MEPRRILEITLKAIIVVGISVDMIFAALAIDLFRYIATTPSSQSATGLAAFAAKISSIPNIWLITEIVVVLTIITGAAIAMTVFNMSGIGEWIDERFGAGPGWSD